MSRHVTLILAAFFSVLTVSQAQLVITAVFDADLPGGLPKGVELYTTEEIPDLSIFGIGSANNGGGSDSVEFTFPALAVDAYSYLYVASDSMNFANFFGFSADFPNVDAMLINGDDAVELFLNGIVIDVFGEIDTDGSGTAWEYKDGWAARKNSTGPDGSTFDIQNWNMSGVAALDGETTNAGATTPVPIMMYNDSTTGGGPDVTVIAATLMFTPRDITIEAGQTVRWTNTETLVPHNVNGGKDVFPCNPVGFFSGVAVEGPWDFDLTFNQPGFYEYQCDPHVSFDMFGSVTVVDPNAPDYPAYDIAALTTVDVDGVADSIGVTCQIEAVVYGVNIRPSGLLFTVIDDTGNGINISKSVSDCYEVTEGDRLVIQGPISQFNGLTRIIPAGRIDVLSSDNPLLDPILVEEALSEATESKFIRIENIRIDTVIATGSFGWNIMASNDNANYTIRMDSDVFDDPVVVQGDIVNVTGIGGQFDSSLPYTDNYQIEPRGLQDVELILATDFLPVSSIAMYPNPASDIIYFDTDLLIQTVHVFNTSGALIAVENNNRLDINHLLPGVYIVKVHTPDGIWTDRFIKAD